MTIVTFIYRELKSYFYVTRKVLNVITHLGIDFRRQQEITMKTSQERNSNELLALWDRIDLGW